MRHDKKDAPSVGGFFESFWEGWVIVMGGTIGIVILLADIWLPAWVPKVVTIGAFIAMMVASYRMWARERWHVIALQNQLMSRIVIDCFDNEECSPFTKFTNQLTDREFYGKEVRFFRVRVRAKEDAVIPHCKGHIIRIAKQGHDILTQDQKCLLPFARNENPDAYDKTITSKAEYLDVVMALDYGTVLPCLKDRNYELPGTWQLKGINLSEVGDYEIDVCVSNDEMQPVTHTVVFSWMGNWKTARMVSKTA